MQQTQFIFIFRVVIALCGGNIDTTALGRTIERGLAVDGRLVRFVVTVSDRPGGIAELTKLIAGMGVRYCLVNLLSDDKILAMSKFKAFADDKSNFNKIIKLYFIR